MFAVLQVPRLALQAVLSMDGFDKAEGGRLKADGDRVEGDAAHEGHEEARRGGCVETLMATKRRYRAKRHRNEVTKKEARSFYEGSRDRVAGSGCVRSGAAPGPYLDRVEGGVPLVVVDGEVKKPVVLEMTAAAAKEGVVVGLSIPQALSRCGGLVVRYRSAQAEAMVEELLFSLAYSLSPRVEQDGPGAVIVDLRGVKLEEALERCGRIVAELGVMGIEVGIGVAESWVVAELAVGEVVREVEREAAHEGSRRGNEGRVLVVGDEDLVAHEPRNEVTTLEEHCDEILHESERIENLDTEVECRVEEVRGAYEKEGDEDRVYDLMATKRHEEARREDRVGEGVGRRPRPTWIGLGDFLEGLGLLRVAMGDGLRDVLSKWGVRTVGAFAGLRRSAVGARLGTEGLQLWDRLTGREERVVPVAELPAVFEESWEFEYDVDSVDPLLFLLRRFLDTLAARMRVSHKVAALMRVELGLAYGEPLVVEQKLPEPTSDAEALFRLMAGRMEGLEAESPVARMVLRLEVADFEERQLGLFESSLKNPYRFTQTISRVAGIIGAERVGRPVVDADGRPDGVRLEALPASVEPVVGELDMGRVFGMPLRRFRPRRAASVEFQGRQPIWIQAEGVSGFVKAVRGPWLHSGHWWEEKGSWNRVEWDVELNKGGVYRICKDELGWRVDGGY